MINLADVSLKHFELSKSNTFFRLIDSNRAYLKHWLNWLDMTKTPQDSFNFIQKSLVTDANGSTLNYFIMHQEQIIGTIALTSISKQEAVIGYWISKHMSGKSITSHALFKLIEIVKQKQLTNRLIIHCLPDNKASIAVAKKAGFVLDENHTKLMDFYGTQLELLQYELNIK